MVSYDFIDYIRRENVRQASRSGELDELNDVECLDLFNFARVQTYAQGEREGPRLPHLYYQRRRGTSRGVCSLP